MTTTLKRLLAASLIPALLGCAGKDFVRPDASMLKNGQTTYAQVLASFGKPYAEGSSTKNEKTIKTTSYVYASAGGKSVRDGIVPARGMGLYFYDDTLVGYEFMSSWAEDQTDFDESKAAQIVKGNATLAEVEQLMGRPSGYFIYPMVKTTTETAAVYAYVEVTRGLFARKAYRKTLVVSLDGTGVVSDVEFSSSGIK